MSNFYPHSYVFDDTGPSTRRDMVVDDLLKKRPDGGPLCSYTKRCWKESRIYVQRYNSDCDRVVSNIEHVGPYFGWTDDDIYFLGFKSDRDISRYVEKRWPEKTQKQWNRLSNRLLERTTSINHTFSRVHYVRNAYKVQKRAGIRMIWSTIYSDGTNHRVFIDAVWSENYDSARQQVIPIAAGFFGKDPMDVKNTSFGTQFLGACTKEESVLRRAAILADCEVAVQKGLKREEAVLAAAVKFYDDFKHTSEMLASQRECARK
jgi:hypothetical protein